jgi:hypothetical protein
VAIACEDGEIVAPSGTLYRQRHVAKGDDQQTKGARSEIRIPTGKLFGLRKVDRIRTPKATGFVKGKRSTGYFSIADLDRTAIHNSAKVQGCKRLTARSTTLTERRACLSSQASALAGVACAKRR